MINIKIIVIIISILFFVCRTGQAYFQDAASGARPAGMGAAFVAVADDANAVLYNPAGFTRVPGVQIMGMYSDLYSGMNPALYHGGVDRLGYNFLSLAVPVSSTLGTVGAAWVQFDSEFYQEDTLTVSYAYPLWPQYGLSIGATAKWLQWTAMAGEANDTESFLDDTRKSGTTFDIGILVTPWSGWDVGASLENVAPADVGMFEKQIVPMILHLGAAYTFAFSEGYLDSLQPVIEWTSRDDTQRFKAGLEAWWFRHFLALRTGVNNEQFTSGLSLRYVEPQSRLMLQVDYAFSLPLQVSEMSGSHRLGLTLGWNPD